MTYIPAVVVGGLISMYGIVSGNMAIGKMMNAHEESRRGGSEMFSTGESTTPGNRRAQAGKWYRQTYPDGPLIKMLRTGQVLSLAGFAVMIALAVVLNH